MTYTLPAGGCPSVPVTASVTIIFIPTAIISYPGAPFCSSLATAQGVNLVGTGNYGGGLYSSTTGLSIDPSTGTILPSASSAGTYTVTYKIPQGIYCLPSLATTIVTIKPKPVASCLPQLICSGQTTNLIISSTIPGSTYAWTASETGVSGAVNGSGDVISQNLFTTGLINGTVVYTIIPSFDGCDGDPINVTVTVGVIPVPLLQDGVICVNEVTGVVYQPYTLNSLLNASNYSFEWYFSGTGAAPIPGATGSSYLATQIGQYTVVATDIATNCVSSPVSATITESFPAIAISSTESPYFTDGATIIVQGGSGHYQYQLNNGPFQSSNVFTNLSSGTYTVVVVDTEGCTNLTKEFTIIRYPVFFTPNNDGFNDYWNIFDLSFQPNTTIYIYDRYGKLLKQIGVAGRGWDGTFNGQQLPSEDYWFVVEYVELGSSKVLKSHFSLKR